MRVRNLAAAAFAGLALALAAPAAGQAADGLGQIDISHTQTDTVAIQGSGIVNAGDVIWDGNTTGSVSLGGED
ncbi:hypothetical protein ABZ990_04235 [Streptomyces sp. NPDC046203]|uniref:hypothetical protein n=1 Tax=Streptomyces sp. NPDC046203 TaxID=3154602 RepID=UPI003402088D